MLTTSDKAWIGGLIAWGGQYLSTRFNWSFITPELIALLTGAAVYWVPNKAPVEPKV
jgi:hypothetical protein